MVCQTHNQTEQAHYLTAILTNALDAIIITDLYGRIVAFNPAAERLFLLERAEVLGLDLHECIIPPTLRAQHRLAMARWAEQAGVGGERSQRMEVKSQRSDGKWLDLQLSLTTVFSMGQHYFVASIQDITERKQSVKALHDALRVAESSNQAKSTFLANINHEIRTSLQTLLGLISLNEQDGLPKEWIALASDMRVAGHALLGNINNILDFSKIEAGTVQIERAPFQLHDLFDTLSTVLSSNATNRQVTVQIAPFLNGHTLLYGDEMRLEQVLTNLANHAMQCIEQGCIEISVSVVNEGAQQVTLRFVVRDTRISTPLEKEHDSPLSCAQEEGVTTRYGRDTDLGLTISQRLVAMMGGKLERISELNRGSAFWFTLIFDLVQEASVLAPGQSSLKTYQTCGEVQEGIISSALASALAQEKPTPALQQSRRLAPLRLLVVDDCAINRQVAQYLFTKEGADVVLAENGQQAVDWLLAHPGAIDLVVMDVQMPIMDGYEAVRLIRNTPALAALPVLAFTAGTPQEQQDTSGMTAVLAKPLQAETAIQLILKSTGQQEKPAPLAIPSPIPLVHPTEMNLPGLVVENGLAVWKNAAVYRQYLSKFAHNYVDVVRDMAKTERVKAAAMAHKLKGAAGSLALEEVAARAAEVDRLLRAEEDPTDSLITLQAALDIALESIHRYVSGVAATSTASSD